MPYPQLLGWTWSGRFVIVSYLRLSVAALALVPSLGLANGGGLLVPVPLSKMLDIDTNG